MIDKKKLFKALDKGPKAPADEVEIEGDDSSAPDELGPYRQIIAAVKANDPEALKEAMAECDHDDA